MRWTVEHLNGSVSIGDVGSRGQDGKFWLRVRDDADFTNEDLLALADMLHAIVASRTDLGTWTPSQRRDLKKLVESMAEPGSFDVDDATASRA